MKLQVFLPLVIALTPLLAACGGDTPSTPANATVPAVAANTTVPASETTGAGAASAAVATSIATLEASPTAELPTMLATGSPTAQTPSVASEAALLEGQALVDLLRRGGNVIFFRHAATDRSQTDSDAQNLENCQTQRNLSEQGRSDARAIGQAFQALGIPVGQVLASPYCRTLETAQLAFGRVEPSRDLLPTLSAEDDARREELVAGLRRLLGTPPATGVNTILVSHQFNLQDATSVSIVEGEAAVFEPVGANGFRLVARVPPNMWATLV
jgi:phosphohistidine phosphatase SixA